jgi:hypothetical protein
MGHFSAIPTGSENNLPNLNINFSKFKWPGRKQLATVLLVHRFQDLSIIKKKGEHNCFFRILVYWSVPRKM